MAATNTTRNKLNRARLSVYWWAQEQVNCHQCKKRLVNGLLSDVDDLTVDHISGTYDHVKRHENGKSKGIRLMHRSCHKSMTMRENKVWQHRHKDNGK
jgi:hypothetical protein